MFFGKGTEGCKDCCMYEGTLVCTMNCGPSVKPNETRTDTEIDEGLRSTGGSAEREEPDGGPHVQSYQRDSRTVLDNQGSALLRVVEEECRGESRGNRVARRDGACDDLVGNVYRKSGGGAAGYWVVIGYNPGKSSVACIGVDKEWRVVSCHTYATYSMERRKILAKISLEELRFTNAK